MVPRGLRQLSLASVVGIIKARAASQGPVVTLLRQLVGRALARGATEGHLGPGCAKGWCILQPASAAGRGMRVKGS